MDWSKWGIDLNENVRCFNTEEKSGTTVTVKEALELLIKEESAKLVKDADIHSEAIKLAEEGGIIFIDEIDKITSKSQQSGEVSREGVQRDILPIVEGSQVNTKYGIIQTDHVLFIASGAFHLSKPSDLIPELQGRFPIRVELDDLTAEDFVKILTEPNNALIKQYVALIRSRNVCQLHLQKKQLNGSLKLLSMSIVTQIISVHVDCILFWKNY